MEREKKCSSKKKKQVHYIESKNDYCTKLTIRNQVFKRKTDNGRENNQKFQFNSLFFPVLPLHIFHLSILFFLFLLFLYLLALNCRLQFHFILYISLCTIRLRNLCVFFFIFFFYYSDIFGWIHQKKLTN